MFTDDIDIRKNHPVYIIKHDIIKLYNRKKEFIENICSNNNNFDILMKNNHDYACITGLMKNLIKNIKDIKPFNLKLEENTEYNKFDIFYDPNDDFYNYYIYDNKIIKTSINYGINNFIYYIIEILRSGYNLSKMLLIIDLYKKIKYNLTIVNRTLGYIDFCGNDYIKFNELILNINILYNKNQKTSIEDIFDDNSIVLDVNSVELDITHTLPRYIPKYIIEINVYKIDKLKYKNNCVYKNGNIISMYLGKMMGNNNKLYLFEEFKSSGLFSSNLCNTNKLFINISPIIVGDVHNIDDFKKFNRNYYILDYKNHKEKYLLITLDIGYFKNWIQIYTIIPHFSIHEYMIYSYKYDQFLNLIYNKKYISDLLLKFMFLYKSYINRNYNYLTDVNLFIIFKKRLKRINMDNFIKKIIPFDIKNINKIDVFPILIKKVIYEWLTKLKRIMNN